MMKLAQFCVSWASFFMPCAMREWDAQKGKSEIFLQRPSFVDKSSTATSWKNSNFAA